MALRLIDEQFARMAKLSSKLFCMIGVSLLVAGIGSLSDVAVKMAGRRATDARGGATEV